MERAPSLSCFKRKVEFNLMFRALDGSQLSFPTANLDPEATIALFEPPGATKPLDTSQAAKHRNAINESLTMVSVSITFQKECNL
mmetsp:Transcript_15494/g.22764  ORF Transcript_15494/g.22764 Transcript_15494/m.22764 type:complete len:85 (+) Transcript_15494:2295-2549(+)